jgi:hypothetical protein
MTIDLTADARLRELAGQVREIARVVDGLWSEASVNGAIAIRLVEASHSLHRAEVALTDDYLDRLRSTG